MAECDICSRVLRTGEWVYIRSEGHENGLACVICESCHQKYGDD